MTLDQIEHEALSLPLDERAQLAQRLLVSLEEISESEFERLWGEESAARAARFDNNETQDILGAEVERKARALLESKSRSEKEPRVLGLGRGKLKTLENFNALESETIQALFEGRLL